MATTFAVDRVEAVRDRAPECEALEALAAFTDRPVLAFDGPTRPVLAGPGCHPFARAVHVAFSEHRPLVLSPDAVWLTIAQGFARHVAHDPKAIRHRLVSHEGVRTVTGPVLDLVGTEAWAIAIEGLCSRVRNEAREVGRWLRNDFSTSTRRERIAGDVALLDALKRYFEYRLRLICGIPEVTLLGEPDDWRTIESRVEGLAGYDLAWWTEWLLPVCRELRRSAEGEPDLDFWKAIYMPEQVYGDEDVTGWIQRFFPYTDRIERPPGFDPFAELLNESSSESDSVFPIGLERNPGLAPWTEETRSRFLAERLPKVSESTRRWLCVGSSLKQLPPGIS